jgi:hypothetical protein
MRFFRIRLCLMLGLVLAQTAFLSAFISSAWAKKVSVQWKPIKGAVSYEIQIEKQGKTIAIKKSPDNEWSGDLNFGVYTYHIRAVDRVRRGGSWTAAHALVVMPKEPENISPKNGEKYAIYTSAGSAKLHWTMIEGVAKYRLIVTKDSEPFSNQIVEDTEIELQKLPPGKYEWQVAGVIEAKGRTPSSLENKKWETKLGEPTGFVFQREELSAPDPVFPTGTMRPTENGKINFKWKAVTGADAYELHLIPRADRSGKAVTGKEIKWVSRSTDSNVNVTSEGSYTWKVRALASVDSNNVAEAVGAESSADFKVDRNAEFWDGTGYVALSTMFAPYTYNVSSPNLNIRSSSLTSDATTLRLSGEYWFKPQWGVGLSAEDSFFQVDGQSFDRKDVEAVMKYRMNLTPGIYGWTLSPKAGLLSREYVLLTPNNGFSNSGLDESKFETFGPTVGFELRKQLSDKLSLGAKFAYYLPVSSGVQRDSASNRNLGLGVQALGWLNRHWGVGLGVYTENRSISHFTTSGSSPDTIYMDGTYIFGSIVYSFGR